jgi:hypothetical protein
MKMMTLRNMRENGVRSLAITCGALWCHHPELFRDKTAKQMLQKAAERWRELARLAGPRKRSRAASKTKKR